jgi:hypothetical protein
MDRCGLENSANWQNGSLFRHSVRKAKILSWGKEKSLTLRERIVSPTLD